MPIIHVEFAAGRTREQKAQVAEALTEAAVRIAGTKYLPVAREDVYVRFSESPVENLAKGGSLDVDIPIIHMELLVGRSQAQKRDLAKAFCKAVAEGAGSVALPVDESDVVVIFVENRKKNSSTGAVLHSDE
jgi:phenylpyruvate tautomerase PptA (4-oxalocrotonate tautomerase family)